MFLKFAAMFLEFAAMFLFLEFAAVLDGAEDEPQCLPAALGSGCLAAARKGKRRAGPRKEIG